MSQWSGPAIATGEEFPGAGYPGVIGLGDRGVAEDEPAGAWDELWRSSLSEGGPLPQPSPRVVHLAERFWRAGARHVLDLGCGSGRHTLYLASRGYHVYASDVSAQAIWACNRALWHAGLRAETVQEPMTELSFPNQLVEWVLAENVIYHGRRSDMRQALSEIRRVLKPGGWLSATFLSTGDDKYRWYRKQTSVGCAEELEPGTFRALFRGPTDEHVPHTFVTREELESDILDGFRDLDVGEEQRLVEAEGGTLAAYFHVVCRK